MATKIRIMKTREGNVYSKGMYSGAVGETFGNGRKFGYHISLARGTTNMYSGKMSFKKKSDAIKAVKNWLNKMDK